MTMKKIFLFILLLPIYAILSAQPIMQKGVAYRYNGKNKRTPIGGVYIKAVTSANGVVSNEQSGAFELALNNLKMGSRIGNVRVTKQGMMIFNQQAVDEWSVRKDPLCLILCNADEFQKQKKNLIAIGESQAKKKYDKKLAELKRQNEALQLQLDDYYNKLDSLEKEYQNALMHMDEYADVFARIDESEVDTVAQHAIELFNRGEIEESIRLLEQQNYLEKIVQANRTIEQADELISTAEQAKELAEQDKQKYLEGIKTQIAGYKLQNEWDKAKELLKGLADNLNSLEAIWEYACFSQEQNAYNEAEIYYLKCQDVLNRIKDIDTHYRLFIQSNIKHNLAVLFNNTQRYSECEVMYKSALEIYEYLAKENPSAFEKFLARTKMNFALMYNDIQCYSKSEIMYKSALKTYEVLAKENPSEFEEYVAVTQMNLALLYNNTQRYAESETMYKSALEIYERLAKENPHAYEKYLAVTYMNLGTMYSDTQRYAESETMYKSALEIYERLAKESPSAFEANLATMWNNLALLYSNTHRYSESEAMYKSALEIRMRLAKANFSVFEADVAMTQMNLAVLYRDTQRYSESEALYKSALAIYESLAKANASSFEPNLAMTQNNLALLYYETQNYAESETMFKSALAIYERLSKGNLFFESYLVKTQHNLAVLYSDTQYYEESVAMYRESLATYLRLYDRHPQLYQSELIRCYYYLGYSCLMLEENNEAKENFKQALSLTHRAIQGGKSIDLYEGMLYYLASIAASEKDYNSVYGYNAELLPLLKKNYEMDMEEWRYDYISKLVSQSFYANLLGKFQEGEQYSLETLKVDSTKHIANTNLAAAYLFQGKVEEAEKLYRQYKAEYKEGFLDDFAEFERLGVIPEERKKDVERIKAMLKE